MSKAQKEKEIDEEEKFKHNIMISGWECICDYDYA